MSTLSPSSDPPRSSGRRRLRRRGKVLLVVIGVIALTVAALAAVGSVRDTHIVTVTRTTDADPEVMWQLWADVDRRTEWDRGLEYIRLDGAFRAGATGSVKVRGQGPISYEVVEVVPRQRFTDRFNSLLGTHTDWHHSIEPRADGRYDVTWRLEARGPLSLLAAPVLTSIFGDEVPTAVDEFVRLAESRS